MYRRGNVTRADGTGDLIFMTNQDQFLDNRKIVGVVPAACLILLTLGSTSLYARDIDIRIPLVTMAVLVTVSLVILILWRKK